MSYSSARLVNEGLMLNTYKQTHPDTLVLSSWVSELAADGTFTNSVSVCVCAHSV